MNKFKKYFTRCLCKHNYHIFRWHWTHGINGNDPSIIQYAIKCDKCGKIKFCDAPRGSGLEECLIQHEELMDWHEPEED